MEIIVKEIRHLVVTPRSRNEWCRLPYPGHPKGCPNYVRKKGCPPGYPFITKIFDIRRPMYAVAVKFNLGEQIERMKKIHPDWTERQCRCCLYWQGKTRKELKKEIKKMLREGTMGDTAEFGPEAAWVDVTATCREAGLNLDWPPEEWVYTTAFIGFKPDIEANY